MKRPLLLLFLLINFSAWSQSTTYVLHPIVGEKITHDEKKKYFLFPEVSDSNFMFCVIKNTGSGYDIISYYLNDSSVITHTDLATLQKYHENIDKLNAYYIEKAKRDSSRRVDSANPLLENKGDAGTVQTITIPKEVQDEARQNARLKEDEIRMNDYRKGTQMDPTSIEIGTFSPKKKKKK